MAKTDRNGADLQWFESWFDSPWYSVLYANRNLQEAKVFATAISDLVRPYQINKVLDMACGEGRYSIVLKENGFDVVGIDLSKSSIAKARKLACQGLSFEVGDMRSIRQSGFDMVISMFTSFGYFESSEENAAVLAEVHKVLRPKGLFLLDFINAKVLPERLVASEHRQIQGADFVIRRVLHPPHLYKHIEITTANSQEKYFERLCLFSLAELGAMLKANGFTILSTFGDYNLSAYDELSSDRLIILAQK